MTAKRDNGRIAIELSPSQVSKVVDAAGDSNSIRALLFGLSDTSMVSIKSALFEDPTLSRSLLLGLLVLAAFPPERGFVGNAQIARTLGMTLTTTHRYISTLSAAGLVERDPRTRKYRLGR